MINDPPPKGNPKRTNDVPVTPQGENQEIMKYLRDIGERLTTMGRPLIGLGFGVWGWGFAGLEVWGLGVWGSGFRVWVWGLRFRI